MAGLAESVSERLTIKLYASATIDSEVEPLASTDPGSSGGQVLRHVSHNLSLTKDNYRPNEKRQDAQQTMGKHGSRTVPGTINGFLSPGTHAIPFQAVMRSVWSDVLDLDESDLTSAALDSAAKTVTFASGDPVALGLRVGVPFELGGLATAGNNRKFVPLSFGGSNNRVVTVYPAPITETADTAFTLTAGAFLVNPPTHETRTDYKAAIEVYNPDIDLSRFYTELRFSGFDLSVGVNANVGLNFSVMGRNRQVLTGAAAPFFTAPTAETTTDIPTAMQGLLLLGGVAIGVVTGLNVKVDLGAEAAKAINPAGLVAGILLGDFVCSGDFTLFLTDGVALAAFDDETELSLMAFLPTSNAPSADANVFYMPRIKINSNNESEVNKAKAIQCQFEAARYNGTAPGVPSTTMLIADTTVGV
ncbi:phage tail tube protein [Rhodopseudomonas sp. RCAM05734]|uniref:phage tail tube protein n=1 Tax=Rhodopseudomonas sp. RCAM05734 TaxID=3457549 RepID=UPI0040445FBC